MDESSPTVRALRALELMQLQPGIDAERLANDLGVSPRAVRRTVQTLRDAGIPVVATRGRYGGYRVGTGTRQMPVVLRSAEALGLVMAALESGHAATEEHDVVGAALGRLLRAMPDTVAAPARAMRAHAAQAATRIERADAGIAIVLVDAVASHERLRIGYRSAGGATWHEEVDPWAVVVRHGLWYLLCHSHRADAVRTYRVDRVVEAEPLGTSFEPHAELDAVRVLEEHLGAGREFRTHVVVHAPIDAVRAWWSPTLGALTAIDDETCVLEGTTSNPRMIAGEWLSALPFDVTVRGGDELRAAVAEVADRLRASIA